jgi:hypothetical protein
VEKKSLKFYAAATILLALTLSGYAQTSTAIIRGTITDKTGAVVAGAKVRLTNSITNYSQETVTDNRGAYRLIDVPFNEYRLAAESAGFEPASREVVVRSNLVQQLDVQLGVAPEEEGQDQRRRTQDNMESFSWEHIFSPNLVSYLAAYQRYNAAKLRSNDDTGPVFAEQSRHHSNYGLLGSLTFHKNHHTIKASSIRGSR